MAVISVPSSKIQRRKPRLSHYSKVNMRTQEIRLASNRMDEMAESGGRLELVRWAAEGEILLDKNAYLGELCDRMMAEIPDTAKERMRLVEFSLFLRKYLQSKESERNNQLVDANRDLLEALEYWARLVIVEAGQIPGAAVWEQVKSVNLGVYKLFEELTTSPESLHKRIQLVHLACEFSIVSKMEDCSRGLLRLLEGSLEGRSIREIQERLGLRGGDGNLATLLNKLVGKGLIREVIVPSEKDSSILDIKYTRPHRP